MNIVMVYSQERRCTYYITDNTWLFQLTQQCCSVLQPHAASTEADATDATLVQIGV